MDFSRIGGRDHVNGRGIWPLRRLEDFVDPVRQLRSRPDVARSNEAPRGSARFQGADRGSARMRRDRCCPRRTTPTGRLGTHPHPRIRRCERVTPPLLRLPDPGLIEHAGLASHPKSHTRHGDTRLATAPDRPTRRVLPSLEDVRLDLAGADEFWVVCESLPRTHP
jgi:hypothetical protein